MKACALREKFSFGHGGGMYVSLFWLYLRIGMTFWSIHQNNIVIRFEESSMSINKKYNNTLNLHVLIL